MADFKRHTIESAPEASKPLLEDSKKSYGMIPNLHAVLAESPETLKAYKDLEQLFAASSLAPAERHVVWLTISVTHACHYCVPAHTYLAHKDGVSDAVIQALRNDRALPDNRLEALRRFTKAVIENRGNVAGGELDAFLEAGFTQRNVFDVLLGISHKTISNYANHIVETPVDAPFTKFDWQPRARAAE